MENNPTGNQAQANVTTEGTGTPSVPNQAAPGAAPSGSGAAGSASVVPPQTSGGINGSGMGGSTTGGNKKKLTLLLIILLVVLLVGGGAAYALMASRKKQDTAQKQSAAKVKIGVLMAFSGGSSSMGYGAIKGVTLAKKQLGASNVEIVQADGKCDATEAPKAMDYLIQQKVQVVIGENCSSASVAVLEQANKNHIFMMSPSASSPKLSIAGDFFFRTVPSDIGQGTFMAQSMYKAGLKNVAVFYTDEPYGAAIKDVFKEQFEHLGGKVLTLAGAASSVIDVQNQVDTIKATKPDGIAIVTNSEVSSAAFMRLARQSGVTAAFYGGDNLYDNTLITNNGAAAEGLHVVSFPTGSKEFKQALVDEYHVTEQLYAAPEAYDAFHAVYMAMQKGARTGDDFKRMMPSIKFTGVSSPIEFDKNGEIPYQTYKYDLLQVKDGEFQLVTQ